MATLKILILEDNLAVLAALMSELGLLEQKLHQGHQSFDSIAVTVFSTSLEVEQIVNYQAAEQYDVILLDRDCKLGGSFHVLNIEKFGAQKIITISMVQEYNQEAISRGISRVVEKDYANLLGFAEEVMEYIQVIIA